jgi:hypothetical protein
MKRALINNEVVSYSDDVFSRCGIKKCNHKGHEFFDGCGTTKLVTLKDSYYANAEQYQSGHLVYSQAKRGLKEGWYDPEYISFCVAERKKEIADGVTDFSKWTEPGHDERHYKKYRDEKSRE